MSNNVLTKDQLKTINKYRDKKMTLRAIAKIFGVSHECIRKALLRTSVLLFLVGCGTENQDQEKQAATLDIVGIWDLENVSIAPFIGSQTLELNNDGTYTATHSGCNLSVENFNEQNCEGIESGVYVLENGSITFTVTESSGDWCTDEVSYVNQYNYTIDEKGDMYLKSDELNLVYSN